MPMKPRQEKGGYFPYFTGVLVIAGIVHVASVLAIPRLAPKDAFARIAALARLNEITLLPQPAPGHDPVPFNDPAVALGVCRYDVSEAPFRISAGVTTDNLLSISFHDRFGHVYYAMTDRAAVRGKIEAVIVTAAQKLALEADDSEDGPGPDLRLVTSQKQGFVLFRALAEQPGDMEAARHLVESVKCVPQRR